MTELLTIHTNRTLGNYNKCWYCGKSGETVSEHFYPKSKGGRLKVRSCEECDKEKGSKTPEGWIKYIEDQINICGGKVSPCYRGEFIRSRCELGCIEYKKLKRMLRASKTLWERLI